jgi:hypothetical protein
MGLIKQSIAKNRIAMNQPNRGNIGRGSTGKYVPAVLVKSLAKPLYLRLYHLILL